MTVAAKRAFGNVLMAATDGGTLAAVAELKSFNPPVVSRGTIDVTTLDSTGGAREFIAEGVYDPGEVSGQVMYIAGSAGDDLLIAAVTSGELHDFKVVMKAGTGTEDLTFSGIVTEYGPDEQTVDGVQTASFKVKVTSAITQAATA